MSEHTLTQIEQQALEQHEYDKMLFGRTAHVPEELSRQVAEELARRPPIPEWPPWKRFRPVEGVDVFLSYSHADAILAQEIDRVLRGDGFSVWRDKRIDAGVEFEPAIRTTLAGARCILLLVTPSFVESAYCQNEVGFAIANDIPLLPIQFGKPSLSGFVAARQVVELGDALSIVDAVSSIVENRIQDSIRPALSVLYDRLERQLCGPGAQSVPVCRTMERLPIEAAGAGAIAKHVAASLREGVPLRHLFPTTAGARRRNHIQFSYDTYSSHWIPAWALEEPVALEQDLLLPPLPTALLLATESMEAGAIVQALPFVARRCTEQHLWQTKIKQHPMCAISGPFVYDHIDNVPGGLDYFLKRSVSFLLFDSGIYRATTVSSDFEGSRVIFSRSVPIETVRLRRRPNDAAGPSRGAETHIQSRNLGVRLTYGGYDPHMVSGRGGDISFFLSNIGAAYSVVDAIRIVVHRTFQPKPIPAPGPAGKLPVHRYEVKLNLDTRAALVTDDSFKYGPGELDKFVVSVSSLEQGVAFEVSVVVEGFDVSTGHRGTCETPKVVVEFPSYR